MSEESEPWQDYEKPKRRSLEETWAELTQEYGASFRVGDGFDIFKAGYEHWELAGFTFPDSVANRCRVSWANFTNSDLHGSMLCWNDFVDCSFRYADLSGTDLRASLWVRCRFNHADLSSADLRGSAFHDCTCVGANLSGCRVVRGVAEMLGLSPEQTASAHWHDEDGDEPPGG